MTDQILDEAATGWMEHCVLLTPSNSLDTWLERLRIAAADRGLDMAFQHFGLFPAAGGEDRRLFVSTNFDILRPRDPNRMPAIVTNVETAFQQTAILLGAVGRDALVDASRLLIDATARNSGPLITDDSLARSGSRVALPAGIEIEAPRPTPHLAASALEAAAIEALSIFAHGSPAAGATCEWRPEVFLYDSRREDERTAVGRLDITGGPCSLVHGPDLFLSAGEWEATARFSVDEDAARHRLAFEWGPTDDLITFFAAPDRPGVYSITLKHRWMSPVPIEFRVRLLEGCMQGTFEFMGVRITRLGD